MARVVFGAPLHNGARHLPEAIETLLSQTERDLALVLVDDASTDATPEIAGRYARLDPRVRHESNAQRLGLVETWRRALEIARAAHPEAEFFAWASDHDAWHPRWLEAMLATLETEPLGVLAYPMSVRMGDDGEQIRVEPPWRFDTAGVADPRERFARFARDGVAGDMVYGLFRVSALAPLQFPRALAPDRLLLARLSLAGEFHQVPEVLWHRRYAAKVSSARQRDAFFPEGRPAWSRVPWPLAHAGLLGRDLVLAGDSPVSRPQGALLAAGYLAASAWRWGRKQALRPVGVASRALRRRFAAGRS